MDTWDSMLDLGRSRPSGLRDLIQTYGATSSYDIAGPLLGVLNQLRQEGLVPASEVNSALFGLIGTLRVWEMEPWAPEGLLNTLERAVCNHGIPDDADRGALAELIERAACQDERSMGCRLEILNLATINLCSSLVNWGELISVLELRPGARKSVVQHTEEMRERLAPASQELYLDEIDDVLKALRAFPATESGVKLK